MLVLSRKKNESIIIRDNIVLTVVEVRGDKVRLGIQAPKGMFIEREEVVKARMKAMREKVDAPPEVRLILDDDLDDDDLDDDDISSMRFDYVDDDSGGILISENGTLDGEWPPQDQFTPPERPVRIDYEVGQRSPEEPLHYEPGVYACVSVDKSQLRKLTDHIDIRSWFLHDKRLYPHPIVPDDQEDDAVMLWLRDEDMNKEDPTLTKYLMSGAPLSHCHVKIGKSHFQEESIDMKERGAWIHIDSDGKAITIEKQYDSVNPPKYRYMPDGKWMGTLIMEHPEAGAVQRYIETLQRQIEETTQLIRQLMQCVERDRE